MTRAADLAVLSPNVAVSGSNMQFDSGYGSVATAYGCRAWVNFNGTGTVAINASGNVSSITDNGTGDYTVNFTNAMPDANYAGVCTSQPSGGLTPVNVEIKSAVSPTTSAFRINNSRATTGVNIDTTITNVAIFR